MVHDDDAATPNSPARRHAIATFRAVTAVQTDAEATRLLRASAWDLDRAASLFLDGAAEEPPAAAEPAEAAAAAPSSPSTPASGSPRRARASAPATPSTTTQVVAHPAPRPRLPRWLAAVFSPIRFVFSLFSSLTQALLRLLGGPARAIEAAPGATAPRRFVNYLEGRYGAAHPRFFDGPYLAALAAAQAQLKFLLVYIHSDAHRLTAGFCRDVLGSEAFIAAADGAFVTWAGSITQRDGAAAHHALRAPGLPFLAVVAAPAGRVAAGADFGRADFGTVLAVRAGPGAVAGGGEGAAGWLERVLARHGPMLEAVRQQRVERESARLLREQQDEEYAAALEADRAREREAAREAARAEGERRRVEELEVRRERKRETLGEEPDKGPGIASVALRLPDGSKVLRRFGGEEALEKVFDWAEVNRVDIEMACLVMSYPRKSFRYPEDGGISVREAGLFPSAMLLLEERSDE